MDGFGNGVCSTAVLGQPILLSLLYYINQFDRHNRIQDPRDGEADVMEWSRWPIGSVSPSLSAGAFVTVSDRAGGLDSVARWKVRNVMDNVWIGHDYFLTSC